MFSQHPSDLINYIPWLWADCHMHNLLAFLPATTGEHSFALIGCVCLQLYKQPHILSSCWKSCLEALISFCSVQENSMCCNRYPVRVTVHVLGRLFSQSYHVLSPCPAFRLRQLRVEEVARGSRTFVVCKLMNSTIWNIYQKSRNMRRSVCVTYGRYEKCMQTFCRKTWRYKA